MKRSRRRRLRLVVFVCCLIALVWYFKYAGHHVALQRNAVPENFWGVTFSKKYAGELGIDWRAAYIGILDELKIRSVRLPVYWDDIEPQPGVFVFDDYDWMLAEGAKRNVHFILNIGRRLPRWPECHQPGWTGSLGSQEELEQKQVEMVSKAIAHFKTQTAVTSWQLENEFFFRWFGRCPEPKPELLQKEIGILRVADARPLVLTDSGELNSWRKAAALSDVLGITVYRVVWNKYFGYFRYPWPGLLYSLKARLVGKSPENTIVAELQAEPWPSRFRQVTEITPQEASDSFNLLQLETNSEIARRTGFRQAYFWGAEWWYWMKQQGDGRIWDAAREIISHGND